MVTDLNRISSASIKTYSAAFPTGNANAVFVASDQIPQGWHWIVLAAEFLVRQTTGYTSGNFPNAQVSGIYLCPENTPQPNGEILNAGNRLQMEARPIQINDRLQGINTALSTDRFSTFILLPQSKVYLPGGFFMQGIANATVVAGFAGIVTLTMQVIIEEDC